MIYNFPENNIFQQNNRSDILGNIWSSFNLNFQENLGAIRVSPRMLLNTSTADDADFGLPRAIETYDGKNWVIAGSKMFVSGASFPSSNFIEDTASGVPTTFSNLSDMETYAGYLWASLPTDVVYRGTTVWTSGALTVSAGSIHLMKYFKKFDRLYVTNTPNSIRSLKIVGGVVTPATSGDYTITLGEGTAENTITSIGATDTSIFIGTMDATSEGKGRILEWDGISAQISREYILNASACVAICVEDNIPYAIDSNGAFLEFTGTAFKEPNDNARLPVSNKLLINSFSTSTNRFIHPNGFIGTKNGTFLALINGTNGDNTATQNENLPSGIWEFDRTIGWTHKYSLSYTPILTSTITDFGQGKISVVGALANANNYSTSSSRNGTILAGATYFTNATSTTNGIFLDDSNDTVQKKGYVVTNWFESEDVEDKFNRLYAKYKRFLNANDKMVFKYRTYEIEPVQATITWTSTNTFTTTTDITAYGVISGTGVGYEVEILNGTGSGSTAHITAISGSGTYTVTIDETITGVTSGTALARFQKWIKIGEIDYARGSTFQWKDLALTNVNDTIIQIKCCMTFTGKDELGQLKLKTEPNIKVNN